MSNQSSGAVHSNAFNFGEFVSGGVDPRTGMYTCSLSLGAIRSADLNGPSFKLSLIFNPLNPLNGGYGTGWSLSTTRYNLRSKVLTLSTGESYKATESRNALQFKEMKLESVKVLKTGDGRYEVRYKDGRREELQTFGATHVAVPVRIMAANGVGVTLEYALFNEQPMLIEIKDAKRTLLKISRTPGRVTLTQNPDTSSSAAFTLTLRNDQVQAIDLPVGGGWNLQYEVIDEVSYLKRVVSPLGAVENIRYKRVGHLLPVQEGVQSLPYVIAHDVYSREGQPRVIKTYTCSDRNYLGHGLPPDPDDDGDPLYRAPADYQYSCVERLIVEEKVHTQIKRTYNKFHLLIAQVTTSGDAIASVAIEYHCDVSKPFNQQPAQFRMPKLQIRSYESRATKQKRIEKVITDFDSVGNLLKQVGTDGVTTRYDYYPASESADCPADPLGFVRFLKEKVVVPATGGGASTVTRFRYGLHPAFAGSTVPNVVPVEERFFERVDDNETLRSTATLTYLNTPQVALTHGVLQEQRVTRNARTTRIEYSYLLDDSTLRFKKTVHGFDGATRSSEQTLSTLSGLTLSERDVDDSDVAFEYDKIGRRLRKTLAPGSAYAATTQWVYNAASATTAATMVVTDPSGGMQTVTYDALGRLIGIQEKDCDNPDAQGQYPVRELYSARHDQTGRLVEQTHTDWWDAVARPFKSQSFYDDWGQVKETHHGDGRIEHSEYDPVARQQQRWQQGMGKTVTLINAFGKPDSVEVFDLKGQSLAKTIYEHDGLGRTISQTDPAGNKTSYEYDVFDRLFRSTLPDGHVVQTEFAAHSTEELPIQITVAGLQLGRQTFDGLNRVTESVVGGRKSVTDYQAGRSWPKSHTSAAGEKIEFVHSSALGGLLTQRKALTEEGGEGLLTSFTYEGPNGKTKSSIEQGREHHFEYFPSGRLKSETTQYGEHRRTASYTYSMAGRPLASVDVQGTVHETGYDAWGREISYRQGAVQAEYRYSKTGLLERIDTRDTSSKRLMTTHLSYDDIGREIIRRFETNGLPDQTLISSYTTAGKLARKIFKRGTLVLRDEQFTYDVRGRLSQHDCGGSQRPRDPYGKEIVRQTFTFDALDNLLTLQTTFPGGSNMTTFSYSEVDPAQLIGVSHSHGDYPPPVALQYDVNGRMIKDDQGRGLTYDAFGRLVQMTDAGGDVIRGYHYDGFDRLIELSQPRTLDAQRYYHDAKASCEIRGNDSRSVVRNGSLVLGQQQTGAQAGGRIFATDQQQSVLAQLYGEQMLDSAYSPYGYRAGEGGLFSLAGFNGEQMDEVTGLYLLGNGYRAYSPTLMRFLEPDSMSPFGAGGLNAYAYCLGDPVNRVDPTGHVSWQSITGIALGILAIVSSVVTAGAATPLALMAAGLGIASGLTAIGSELAQELAPQSGAGSILGWVSLGLGIASAAAGALAVRQAYTQTSRARAYIATVADEPPVKIVEKEYAMFGMPKDKKGRGGGARGAATQAEPPANWSVTEDFARYDFLDEGKRGVAQRAKYDEYKKQIVEHNTHPREAAKVFPAGLYENYPVYKNYHPTGAHKGFTHAHMRLTQEHRMFFLVNDDTRHIIFKQIGNHDPKWV